ncbi:glycosyltransferase involved in cell wall biosynthesis [Pontibacter aydingkolensis]|uniref:Glycosyltransferase n=1 Tax=Pontibacter aydingkolensis TaxID=1911536 RepID=A0ABS7CTL5_9BACT|nr:glycosyltransferase [Pontibacter aydingkolensis]MBW7467201.1 glycosyltransferase [Pontibacter aydingkolensis]
MRILFITPYYKPAWFYGGPSKCIAEQAESLQREKDVYVEVVTLNQNGSGELYPHRDKPVVLKVDGVKVHYLPIWKNTLGKKYFIGKDVELYLNNFRDYDLIHVHTLFNFMSKTGMAFSIKFNIPFVVTPHGMLDKVSLSRSYLLKIIHRFFYEDRFLKKAKFIQFTTDGEQNDAIFERLNHAGVIPIGIKFDSGASNNRVIEGETIRNKFKLVFLGRINRIKGLDLLFKAIAYLNEDIKSKITVDIYGDDDDNYLDELLQLRKRLELTTIVVFKGKLDPALRNETLGAYDALVLTSYLESFGLVVVEALDLGLPVLVTERVKLANLIIDNNCGWVSSLNVEEVAATIVLAFNSGYKARYEMGVRGAKAVRVNFSLDKVTADLIKVYKR